MVEQANPPHVYERGIELDGERANLTFRALADPGRRVLLDSLNENSGQTLGELSSRLRMTRQSASKHLTVLETANLISVVWRGRQKLHYLNPEPINAISDRWIRNYDRARVTALADLKTALEDRTMSDTEFVYTTYIEAPPELVWRGLTDPAFTRHYWGMEFDTDWQPGSHYTATHVNRGITVADSEMVITAYEPFTRLSYTWEAYPKELTDAAGFGDEFGKKAAIERRSTVVFEIEERGTQTRLTVIHSGFEQYSVVFPAISDGWPWVISGLKTFLESARWQDVDAAVVRR